MGSGIKPKETLDCIGLYCPQPLFQTRDALNKIPVGEVLEILADDPAAESDLKRFCKRTGHELLHFERLEDGTQKFLIRRVK
jgi:tRNA 2-thiouridine synthesizing protein A